MKTLRKIGTVTVASSLALASALASPVAESIATFGSWGLWILGIMIAVEVVRTLASLSHPSGKGTIGSAAAGKLGDWVKKRAKRMATKEIRVEGEAGAEYKWLEDLRNKVNASNGSKASLDDIKSDLRKEEREERRFNRRLEQLLDDAIEFKKGVGDPSVNVQVDRIIAAINPLNKRLILFMAREGKLEHVLERKKWTKQTPNVNYADASYNPWNKRKAEILSILDDSISADRGIVVEVKKLEDISKKVKSS